MESSKGFFRGSSGSERTVLPKSAKMPESLVVGRQFGLDCCDGCHRPGCTCVGSQMWRGGSGVIGGNPLIFDTAVELS